METQSEDRKEYKANYVDEFIVKQEIFFNEFIRPAIKEDVREQFQECSAPIVQKLKGIETRLLAKTVAFVILIVISLLVSISLTTK